MYGNNKIQRRYGEIRYAWKGWDSLKDGENTPDPRLGGWVRVARSPRLRRVFQGPDHTGFEIHTKQFTSPPVGNGETLQNFAWKGQHMVILVALEDGSGDRWTLETGVGEKGERHWASHETARSSCKTVWIQEKPHHEAAGVAPGSLPPALLSCGLSCFPQCTTLS